MVSSSSDLKVYNSSVTLECPTLTCLWLECHKLFTSLRESLFQFQAKAGCLLYSGNLGQYFDLFPSAKAWPNSLLLVCIEILCMVGKENDTTITYKRKVLLAARHKYSSILDLQLRDKAAMLVVCWWSMQ